MLWKESRTGEIVAERGDENGSLDTHNVQTLRLRPLKVSGIPILVEVVRHTELCSLKTVA